MSTAVLEAPPTGPSVAAPSLLEGPEEFSAWLRSLAPDARCGRAHHAEDCPLARYLRVCNPAAKVSIGSFVYHVGQGGRTLPLWAARFVRWVDAHPGKASITVHDALASLGGLS